MTDEPQIPKRNTRAFRDFINHLAGEQDRRRLTYGFATCPRCGHNQYQTITCERCGERARIPAHEYVGYPEGYEPKRKEPDATPERRSTPEQWKPPIPSPGRGKAPQGDGTPRPTAPPAGMDLLGGMPDGAEDDDALGASGGGKE